MLRRNWRGQQGEEESMQEENDTPGADGSETGQAPGELLEALKGAGSMRRAFCPVPLFSEARVPRPH